MPLQQATGYLLMQILINDLGPPTVLARRHELCAYTPPDVYEGTMRFLRHAATLRLPHEARKVAFPFHRS
ncbi:hypothetical protein AB0F88_42825 [Streptosporangium sp. NPDC023963]|uniref:hypothetical protein n=1 Tax=Streptosporangium sp. NPDC023963 TaxID=3155608 RepID=UPI00342762B5